MKLTGSLLLCAGFALLMQPGTAPAQSKTQLSDSDRSAIDLASRRGAQLFNYDQAAWHGTDDIIKKLPKFADIVGGYIVDGPIDRPEIVFFDRDQQHPHAVYVGRMENFKIVSSKVLAENERPELAPERVALVRARSAAVTAMAQAQLRPCSSKPFNSVVLPPERAGGPTRVYFLTPQTTNDRVPFGGHFVVEVAADGTASKPRAFTNSCLEQASASFRTPEGGTPVTSFITHVLDPVPTEIHVFSSAAAKLPVHVNAVLPTSRVFLVTPKSIELLDKVPPMIQAQVDAALRAAQAENAARAASAQSSPQLSASDRTAMDLASRRGLQLFVYDRAAARGTDDMVKKLPKYGEIVGGYVVDGPADRPEIIFYDRDQQQPHAVYVGQMENDRIVSSKVLGPGDNRDLTPARVAMIKARSAASAAMAQTQFRPCAAKPFNIGVLPPESPGGPMRVYFLTPQADLARIPFGGHFLVEVAADGRASQPRALSNTCIDGPTANAKGPNGETPTAAIVSHLLDTVPTEIHVFSSYAARLPVGVNITNANRVFMVLNGTIQLLDMTPGQPALAQGAAQPAPAPARAPPPPIAIPADASWTHAPSGIALPPAIGPYSRGPVTDGSNGALLNVLGQYADPISQTAATVYIYHAAMPSSALWFDAASNFILSNVAAATQPAASFGTVTPHGQPASFALPGSRIASGLRQAYGVTLRGRSTGVAIVAMGEWVVKLRMTSIMLDPPQLDMTMMRFISQVGWPSQLPPMAAASPLLPCTRPLPALAPAAKVKLDDLVILLNARLGTAAADSDEKTRKDGKVPPTPALCADPVKLPGGYFVYRSEGNETRYFMTLGDGGVLLSAEQYAVPAGQAQMNGPYYRMTVMTHNQWVQLPGYATLPSPAQAVEILKERPLSITPVYGPNKNVQILAPPP